MNLWTFELGEVENRRWQSVAVHGSRFVVCNSTLTRGSIDIRLCAKPLTPCTHDYTPVYISPVRVRPLYFKRMFIENKRVQLEVKFWVRHVVHYTERRISQTENNKGLASTLACGSKTSKSLGRGLENYNCQSCQRCLNVNDLRITLAPFTKET